MDKIHEHCCPSCGKIHECARLLIPGNNDISQSCENYYPLPCSMECARQMDAIRDWLRINNAQ